MEVKLQLWDPAGAPRIREIRPIFFRGAGAAILVFDLTRQTTMEQLDETLELIKQEMSNNLRVVYLVGNKLDLKNEIEVSDETALEYAKKLSQKLGIRVPYVKTSAKTGSNITELINGIATDYAVELLEGKAVGKSKGFLAKVIFIGVDAVGKTSLRRRITGEGFTTDYIMTIGADFATHSVEVSDTALDKISKEEFPKDRELEVEEAERKKEAPKEAAKPSPRPTAPVPVTEAEPSAAAEEAPAPLVSGLLTAIGSFALEDNIEVLKQFPPEKLQEAIATLPPEEQEALRQQLGDLLKKSPLERKASLIYWERMCLKEEFDLIVSLHEKEFKVEVPIDATVRTTGTMTIPHAGRVRITPICTACNISPAYREVTVREFEKEVKAEFKVLPTITGASDLTIEFHLIDADGSTSLLQKESVEVIIQEKPIEYQLDGLYTFKVSRRVPAMFSIIGGLFGAFSIVLSLLFGIDLQEEALSAIAAISSALAATILILIAVILLWRGVKPLKREIEIIWRGYETPA